MQTPLLRRLSGLTLAVLLLIPAMPAMAGLDLELAAALEAQGSTFGLAVEPESSSATEGVVASEINLSEMRAEAWAIQEDDDPPESMEPKKKRGWGRWLKKHWYVPVLAAVLLGVALDGGDDDKSGEDD